MRSRTRRNGALFIFVALALTAVAGNIQAKPAWNPPLYFAPEHYAEIEGMKICYLEAGDPAAPAIVFIHGWSGDVMNWWDQYDYFRDNYHVVILDDPGHGKSERRKDIKYSMELDGKVVVGLMDLLKIDKAVVVGNSMGGQIAEWVAVHRPERVSKLVLCDAAGATGLAWVYALTPLINPVSVKMVVAGEQYKEDTDKDRAREAFVESRKGTDQEWPYYHALSASIKDLIRHPIKQDLGKIAAPTLIIWGDNDPTINPKAVDTFSSLIPDTRTYIVHDGGHTPMMQKPSEWNCAVDKFIRGEDMEGCR